MDFYLLFLAMGARNEKHTSLTSGGRGGLFVNTDDKPPERTLTILAHRVHQLR